MRSVRTKLLILVWGAVFGVYILLAVIAAYHILYVIDSDADQTMTRLSDQKAGELNLHFSAVERAVGILCDEIEQTVDPQRLKKEPTYAFYYYRDLAVQAAEAARITGDIETVYFRPDPEIYGGTAGIFLTGDGYGGYIRVDPTDILQYEKDDREHVGWYYEPKESGRSIWMEPYANKNVDVYMISYVTPINIGGHFLGVVGMDVNMSKIHGVVDSIAYREGFGFLIGENGNLVYHRDYPQGLLAVQFDEELYSVSQYLTPDWINSSETGGYYRRGELQRMSASRLQNGMTLVVSAPESEIRRPYRQMWRNMLLILSAALFAALFLVWKIMTKIVRPIQDITSASSRIARGELNVPIPYRSEDEIGALAESIRLMARELQEYIAYIHTQAYTDAMTGVGNKLAYMDQVKLIDRKIHEELAEFSLAVFDINGLKSVNDRLGHEFGDLMIADAAGVMKMVFGTEHIYRVGGDVFVAILENTSESEMKSLLHRFDEEIVVYNESERRYDADLSMSCGVVTFDPARDREFKDVFHRADREMYRNKERFNKQK
ncbi:MAG: diguanylate cyclase [Lachnospiraceae bacterium]|nr:diguanylate cyclase [Lachnospiraceae bacterium]